MLDLQYGDVHEKTWYDEGNQIQRKHKTIDHFHAECMSNAKQAIWYGYNVKTTNSVCCYLPKMDKDFKLYEVYSSFRVPLTCHSSKSHKAFTANKSYI